MTYVSLSTRGSVYIPEPDESDEDFRSDDPAVWDALVEGCQALTIYYHNEKRYATTCGFTHGDDLIRISMEHEYGRIQGQCQLVLCRYHFGLARESLGDELSLSIIDIEKKHEEEYLDLCRERQLLRTKCRRCARADGRSKIYFIEKDGLIKVGFTTRIEQRMTNLKPDTIHATVDGSWEDERAIHRLLHGGARITSEWYERSPLIEVALTAARQLKTARGVIRRLSAVAT